jgi:hypothetical protein
LEAATVIARLVASGAPRLRVAGLRWKDAMVLRGFDELRLELT